MPSNVLFMIYLKIRMDQYVLNSLLILWSDSRTFFDVLRDSCIVWCFVNKLLNFPYLWYLCRILRSEVYVLDFLGVLASLTTWKWHAHNDTQCVAGFRHWIFEATLAYRASVIRKNLIMRFVNARRYSSGASRRCMYHKSHSFFVRLIKHVSFPPFCDKISKIYARSVLP